MHLHHDSSPKPECDEENDYFTFFAQDLERHSVDQEDKDMWEKLFRHRTYQGTGTYMEIGGFNGMRESNTRFYDECLGWEGLLVEANPTTYSQLARNRPHSHRLNYAPSCTKDGQQISFYATPFTNSGQADTLPDGLLSKESLRNVSCTRLGPVIEELLPRITFFSLDVEGAEFKVLQTIDFGKVFIEVIMAESWNAHCPAEPKECLAREQVRRLMKENGYLRANSGFIRKSDVYVHPKSELVKLVTGESARR